VVRLWDFDQLRILERDRIIRRGRDNRQAPGRRRQIIFFGGEQAEGSGPTIKPSVLFYALNGANVGIYGFHLQPTGHALMSAGSELDLSMVEFNSVKPGWRTCTPTASVCDFSDKDRIQK
jgi:hypothetical protein